MGSTPRLVFSMGLALMCFSQLLVLASSEPSNRLLRFASMWSAKFTNEEQVREESASGQPTLDVDNMLLFPIHVPAFDPAVTLYVQVTVNGEQLARRFIAVFGEDDATGLVYFKRYALTRSLPDKPLSSDSFETWTLHDLDYEEGCDATFYEIDDGIFLGEFPICEGTPVEAHVFNPNVLTCHVMGMLVPDENDEPEKSSRVPYQMRPTTRYPLLPYTYAGVGDYENPCP